MYFIYLIITIFCLYYIDHKFSKRSDKIISLLWFVLFVLMGTFGFFTDDYEPYVDLVSLSYASPFSNIHMESIWIGLAELCNGNIDYFRLISFCSLAIAIFYICKLLNIQLKYFICYYSLICLSNHLCWIRQPLAMCLFILGTALLFKRRYLLSIIVLLISTLFHKTNIVFICFLVFTLIPVKKKYIIWIYFLSGVMLIFGFNIIFQINLPISDFLTLYLESEGEFASRNIVIVLLSNIILLLQTLQIIGTLYHFNSSNNIIIQFYVRYIVGLTSIAIALMFIPYETGVMVKRIMAMASLCNVLILSISLKSRLFNRKYYRIYLSIILPFVLSQMLTLGNNYTRISKLTRIC